MIILNNILNQIILINSNFLINLLLIKLYIIFVIFTIFGLTETSLDNLRFICYKSNLWYYLIVRLILGFNFNLYYFLKKNIAIINLLFQFIIVIFFFSWGYYELFYVDCIQSLNHLLIYKVVLAYWLYNGLLLLILVIYLLFNILKNLYCDVKNNNESNEDNTISLHNDTMLPIIN